MSFIDMLAEAWRRHNSLLCVGLDPDPARFPAGFGGDTQAVFEFCAAIVDATAGLVCAYKPQFAHFAALGAEAELERLIAYIRRHHAGIPVILDSKRGDIGSTAERYAREAFERYGADAVTVNPYLGQDAVAPFLDYADKGVIVLCRTSNAGAGDFQDLDCGGVPLYRRVAATVAQHWNTQGNCLLVVGATCPRELGEIRTLVGDMPILVPGVGTQGGNVEQVVRHGCTRDGAGLIVSASRAVLYASNQADFAVAARNTASALRYEINRYR